jgi:tRNA pseudouridine55 synthase
LVNETPSQRKYLPTYQIISAKIIFGNNPTSCRPSWFRDDKINSGKFIVLYNNTMAGFILVNKPKGITSHDVIYKIRRLTGEKRVGHGGTLDPNATGLLIVGVGREATRELDRFTRNKDKTYEAEIILGEERTTDDIEGEIRAKGERNVVEVTKNEISEVIKKFTGQMLQTPPAFSAIKVKGKKSYELARKGKAVNLAARKVNISKIDLLKFAPPALYFECRVSSGTYIRALARDIGRELGTGAYLKELKRTSVGEYSLNDAVDLESLERENIEKYIKWLS